MKEQMRTKCPSCGVVLEVKNPLHEASKSITCPRCKRQLTIDFQKVGSNAIFLPGFEQLCIDVVRIIDGSLKYLASVHSKEPTVLLNDEPLIEGDKMLMAVGDKLRAGDTVLSFGKPIEKPTPPPPAPPHPKRNFLPWLGGGMVCVLVALLLWKLFPAKEVEKSMDQPVPIPVTEMVEAPQRESVTEDRNETKPADVPMDNKADEPKKVTRREPAREPAKEQTDYDLEVLCAQGNTAAMYELGRRWVNTGKHRQGVQYLQQAAAAGHAGAKCLLDNNNW